MFIGSHSSASLPEIESIFFTVTNEISVLTGMRMIVQRDEKPFVEFECRWIDLTQLPNRFDELQKDRRLFFRIVDRQMSTSIREFVTERKPFLLD